MKLAQVELAGILSVSVQTFQKWQKQPGFPQGEKSGRKVLYDVPAVMEWWRDHEINKIIAEQERLETQDYNLDKERARLASAQADRQELMLLKDRGELVSAEDATAAFYAAGRASRDAFDMELKRSAAKIAKAKDQRTVVTECQSLYRAFHRAFCNRLEEFLEEHQDQDAGPD